MFIVFFQFLWKEMIVAECQGCELQFTIQLWLRIGRSLAVTKGMRCSSRSGAILLNPTTLLDLIYLNSACSSSVVVKGVSVH